eukprot:gb/GEZN01009435.1/.p1 GENE.gb/GEZN01009435.1/~~gb/GEZN01009435.1/.p1  ORF type:complete len:312 (-),score=27.11 gb/GEZN01009435.1/:343-1278(-)
MENSTGESVLLVDHGHQEHREKVGCRGRWLAWVALSMVVACIVAALVWGASHEMRMQSSEGSVDFEASTLKVAKNGKNNKNSKQDGTPQASRVSSGGCNDKLSIAEADELVNQYFNAIKIGSGPHFTLFPKNNPADNDYQQQRDETLGASILQSISTSDTQFVFYLATAAAPAIDASGYANVLTSLENSLWIRMYYSVTSRRVYLRCESDENYWEALYDYNQITQNACCARGGKTKANAQYTDGVVAPAAPNCPQGAMQEGWGAIYFSFAKQDGKWLIKKVVAIRRSDATNCLAGGKNASQLCAGATCGPF